MNNLVRWVGIAITLIGIIVSGTTGYAKLGSRIERLEEKNDEIKKDTDENEKDLKANKEQLIRMEMKQDMMKEILEKIDKKLE